MIFFSLVCCCRCALCRFYCEPAWLRLSGPAQDESKEFELLLAFFLGFVEKEFNDVDDDCDKRLDICWLSCAPTM